MCEPLRGKIDQGYDLQKKDGSVFKFIQPKDVKSAVEFYKKYRVSTKRIKMNYQLGGIYNIELWDDFPKLVKQYLDQDEKAYNEWLFDYCFGDVIEK